MPYVAWRAIRVLLWTAFCAVAALFLWHKAQEPLNGEATRLEVSPKSGRFGAVNLCVCMWPNSNGAGSPQSGVLLIGQGAGSWLVSLPDLTLAEPGPAGDGSAAAVGKPGRVSETPLTEAALAHTLTGTEWPSADREFNADMDEQSPWNDRAKRRSPARCCRTTRPAR
jgi:hypothetical protein